MDKLDYVLTLAEERNLTRAANRLFISQPSLTNYINRLESSLGIKLFDRSVQPIEVTDAGRIYIEGRKKIQMQEAILQSKLDALKQDCHTFVVGTPTVRSMYVLPQIIARFLQLHPELNLIVDNRLEEELEKDVAAGRVDIAMGMLSIAYHNIHYECIREDRIVLLVPRCCIPELKADEATPENLYLLDREQLNHLTMLLPQVGGGHHRLAMRIIERYGLMPSHTVQDANLSLLYQLVGEGVGFLFTTPAPFLKAFPQYTDHIAYCTLEQEELLQKTYIGYLDDNPLKNPLKDFIELLKEGQTKKGY